MQQVTTTPMLRHARRPSFSSLKPQAQTDAGEKDPRWHILDLAKTCRQRLKLRDRDIAVLRGLLSLLPSQARPDQMVIFASNRVLIERCDGIDERTLRRRLAHLQGCGMLARRLSPNGKRYQVRDEQDDARLTYGIDLAPLFHLQPHLEALAEDCHRETLRIKVLRSMIRDFLFKTAEAEATELQTEALRALRRSLDSVKLQEILAQLETSIPHETPQLTDSENYTTEQPTVSDGHFDRHIQNSNKETYESERAENHHIGIVAGMSHVEKMPVKQTDIMVAECIELATTAKSMAPALPECWEDLIQLATTLAPAIGLTRKSFHEAEKHLGRHGCALAVLGLVEAFDRVRNPEGYLAALVQRSLRQGLDLVRMFRSLVRPVRVMGRGI